MPWLSHDHSAPRPVFHYLASIGGFFVPAAAALGSRHRVVISALGIVIAAGGWIGRALPYDTALALAQGAIGVQLALWGASRWRHDGFHTRVWSVTAALAWLASSVCFVVNTSLEVRTGQGSDLWLLAGRGLLLQAMPLAIAVAAAPAALRKEAPPRQEITMIGACLWIPTYVIEAAGWPHIGVGLRAVVLLFVLIACGLSVFPPGSALLLKQRYPARALWAIAWITLAAHAVLAVWPPWRLPALHAVFIFTLLGGIAVWRLTTQHAYFALGCLGMMWGARVGVQLADDAADRSMFAMLALAWLVALFTLFVGNPKRRFTIDGPP